MWTINNVLEGMGGELEGRISGDNTFNGFSIDTRTLQGTPLFFALSGPNFDGHRFVEDALRKGAAGAVVSKRVFKSDPVSWQNLAEKPAGGIILVDDPLKALQSLAKWHRKRFERPLVGITGSNGKTTTKEMLAQILSQRGAVLKTEGNYNNHIGLPLTLLQLKPEHASAVIEMGINKTGEMSLLCEIAQPTVGLITNIGPAHLEGLGNLEGVASEKTKLFETVKTGGTAIINQDDAFLKVWKNQASRYWTFGLEQRPDVPDLSAEDLKFKTEHTNFTLRENRSQTFSKIRLSAPGKHNVSNALAAAAAACALGVPLKTIAKGLRQFKPLSQRTEILQIKEITVLFDAYNANPASVKAALDLLVSFSTKKGKRIAILGDMFELGDVSNAAHFEIGEYAAKRGVDRLIAVGQYAGKVAEGALAGKIRNQDIIVHPNLDTIKPILDTWVKPGDLVLIKGSRGMKMEQLLPLLGWEKSTHKGQPDVL